MNESNRISKNIGIHLAGPNSDRSVVVVMKAVGPSLVVVDEIYDKVGGVQKRYSDDRLVALIKNIEPSVNIFVDAPLTTPPCVACVRPKCPGVVGCEDISVAYMLRLGERLSEEKKIKKRRPLNPQSHRVWDAINLVEGPSSGFEPTYSANKAPLHIRANTLQKRLNFLDGGYELKETSVLTSLLALQKMFDRPAMTSQDIIKYRSFEHGRSIRAALVKNLARICDVEMSELNRLKIESSAGTFEAFVCAQVGLLYEAKKVTMPPESLSNSSGWVYTPVLSECFI